MQNQFICIFGTYDIWLFFINAVFICAYTIYTFIYSYNRGYFDLIIRTYESDGLGYKIK